MLKNIAELYAAFMTNRAIKLGEIMEKVVSGCPQVSSLGLALWMLVIDDDTMTLQAVLEDVDLVETFVDDKVIVLSGASLSGKERKKVAEKRKKVAESKSEVLGLGKRQKSDL